MTQPPPSRPISIFGFLLSWLYTVYASLVFCIVTFGLICPLILLLPGVALRRHIGGLGMRLELIAMGVPFRVSGLHHLPAEPCIVVCNHASYIDGMIMTAALPQRFSFVVQHEVANWFYVGRVLRRMDYRFINRINPREGAAQARGLINDLQQGQSLVIFAEGTFQPEPGLLPFKNGAFMMAAKARVPIVPIGLRGTRRLLNGVSGRLRWSTISVQIGEAIEPGQDIGAMRDAVRASVLTLCGEPDSTATPRESPQESQIEVKAA